MAVLPAAHLVHFYSTSEGLAQSLTGFFAEPLKRGESVIIVARPEHRKAFEAALRDAGVDLTAEIRAGRYVSLDVNETLDSFLVDGRPNRELFDTLAPAMVHGAKRRTGNVHVYGEMIAALVDRGDIVGAMEFEAMWGELVRESPFPLICGYPREMLEGDLATVIDGVSSVHDAFLATRSPARRQSAAVVDIALGPDAARLARRHLRDLLTTWGSADAESLDDAAIVVSELVGTAARQGSRRVNLNVTFDDAGVLLSLLDVGPRRKPARGTDPEDYMVDAGRAFTILAVLAAGWGIEQTGDGTRFWARLRLRSAGAGAMAGNQRRR